MSSNASETPIGNSSSYQYIFKIILTGNSGSGKTSIIRRFIDRTFDDNYTCTIGVDFFMKTLNLQNKIVKLQVWDTAGMEKYRSISASYYRGSHAAFIVFDLTSRASFDAVPKWIEAYYRTNNENEKNVVLIGNKSDLEELREVSTEEAQSYAEINNMAYFETSAKLSVNVEEVFHFIADKLLLIYKDKDNAILKKDVNRLNKNFTEIIAETENEKNKCCK